MYNISKKAEPGRRVPGRRRATMKQYTIKPEYLPLWGEDADENTIITQDDIERFAADWEKPVEELLEQLEEYTGSHKED